MADVSLPVLSICGLRVGYDGQEHLHVPRLDVANSEIVAVVGRSGAGKTSLLSCLSGQLEPLGGTFHLGGAERGVRLRSTFVSRTLQSFPLFHWLTVEGNLLLAARIRGVPPPPVEDVLSNFSAIKLRTRYPETLSGGERCRASLSQAFVGRPALLLLDEPFTGLDAITKRIVARNLFEVARAARAAILFVTHDVHDAVEFAGRIVVVGGGRSSTVVGEVSSSDEEAARKTLKLLSQYSSGE